MSDADSVTYGWEHQADERCLGKPVNSRKLGKQFCCRRVYVREHGRVGQRASARASRWSKANPGRRRAIEQRHYKKTERQKKDYYLRYTYGLSLAEYEAMAMAQCGLCAICGELETKVQHNRECRLSVHHDHATGRVIALLCAKCNRGMGLLCDDPDLLLRAATLQKGR